MTPLSAAGPLRLAWLTAACLAWLAAVASADEPQRLYGRHFLTRFREADRSQAYAVTSEADALADRLQSALGVNLDERAEIILCATPEVFDQAVGARQPAWIAGIAEPARNRIVLRLGSVKGLRRVTRHEVVHLLVGKALGPRAAEAPQWVQEGAAKYYGEDWTVNDRIILADAVEEGRRHTLAQLGDFPEAPDESAVAYAESYVLVEYLASLDPPRGLTGFLREYRLTGDLGRAFLRAYGLTDREVEAGWSEAVAVKARGAPASWAVESTIFLLLVVVFVFAYVRVRRRSREIRQRMEEEERSLNGTPDP